MRPARGVLAAVLGGTLWWALPIGASSERQQTVVPLTPAGEQAVERLTPATEQAVEQFGTPGVQNVEAGYHDESKTAAANTTKAVVAILGATVALATAAAFLFLI
jgi:hypothetical protein